MGECSEDTKEAAARTKAQKRKFIEYFASETNFNPKQTFQLWIMTNQDECHRIPK